MEIIIGLSAILVVVILYIWIKTPDEKWEVGDFLILNSESPHQKLLKECNTEFAKLVGWNKTHVFCEFELNGRVFVRQIPRDEVYANKSAVWRKNYDECTKFMGTEPNFLRGAKQEPYKENVKNENNNNDDVDTFNETQCQIHLKIALENDQFERAAKIRDRLDKHFR